MNQDHDVKENWRRRDRGMTLIEVLVAMSIAGVMMAMAMFNYRALQDPVKNGAQALMGFVKKARAKGLSSTLAYTIVPTSATHVITRYGTSCSATTQTADSTMTFNLPTGARMTSTGWSICYGTRGIANSSADIIVTDGATSKTVQIVLGGGVRVQ